MNTKHSMRRNKDPETRKSEILDAAERLFAQKGYSKTTVTDIINVYGLSKGVFYYYFASKEEVMDAIIQRNMDLQVANAKQITASSMSPSQKICAIILGQGLSEETKQTKSELIEHFKVPENAVLHQKVLAKSIELIAPVIASIVTNASDKDMFSTDYPVESAALLMTAGEFIFDPSMFSWTNQELACYAAAFTEMIEKTLGAKKGSFDDIKDLFTSIR